MGNGERGTGNGERGTGNGEWGMGNGKWEMGNGTWEIEKWKVVVSVHTKSRPIYLSIINYIFTTSNNLLFAITMQHNGRRP